MKKTIQITKQQFDSIENVFFQYIQNNPNDQEALKTMQSIIDQCID